MRANKAPRLAVAVLFAVCCLSMRASAEVIENLDVSEPIPEGVVCADQTCGTGCPKKPCYDDCCSSPWAGPYIGVHGGYGWSEFDYFEFGEGGIDDIPFGFENGIFGVHGGYNWQSGNLVYGIEADWTDLQLENWVNSAGGNVTRDIEYPWLSTVRGRVGFSTGRVLMYGTVGAAFVETETLFDNPAPGMRSASSHETTATFGGGLEVMMGKGWLGRLEYLYVDHDPTFSGHAGFDEGRISSEGIFTARLGLSRKFGPGTTDYCETGRCETNYFETECCEPDCCTTLKGLYVGGHGAYAWTDLTYTEIGPGGSDVIAFDFDGGSGGAHVGHNWQHRNIIYGVEADWTDMQLDDQVVTGNGNVARRVDVSWLQTVRGRVGYCVRGIFFYGTAGIAFTETNAVFENPSSETSQSSYDTSFAGGAGVEANIIGPLSARIEYLFVNLDSSIGTHSGFDEGPITSDGLHTLRLGATLNLGN